MSSKASNEALIERIKQGDEAAKQQFVMQNGALVRSIVNRFSYQRGSNEDLYQIGCVGLMKALNNFDTAYQVKFSTYAVPIIMGEIKRYFRDDGSMRISRSLKEGYLQIQKAREQLQQQLSREPTYQELATFLKKDVSEVVLALEANQFLYSLDEPIYESDGSTIVLEDKVSGSEPEDVVMKLSLRKEILELEERERLLLHYRYDLDMKQEQIAKRLHISQVQVSRLEKRILNKLKERLAQG